MPAHFSLCWLYKLDFTWSHPFHGILGFNIFHWKAAFAQKDFLSEKVLGVWGRLRVEAQVRPFSYYLPLLLTTFLLAHKCAHHQCTRMWTIADSIFQHMCIYAYMAKCPSIQYLKSFSMHSSRSPFSSSVHHQVCADLEQTKKNPLLRKDRKNLPPRKDK